MIKFLAGFLLMLLFKGNRLFVLAFDNTNNGDNRVEKLQQEKEMITQQDVN